MPSQEDITEQLELLRAHRQTLAVYLRQRALVGAAFIPPGIANGIEESRNSIRYIKEALRNWGTQVEDHPNDEEPTDKVQAKPAAITNSTPNTSNKFRDRVRSVLERQADKARPRESQCPINELSNLYILVIDSDLRHGSLLSALLRYLKVANVLLRMNITEAQIALTETAVPDIIFITHNLGGSSIIDLIQWFSSQRNLDRALRVLISDVPEENLQSWIDDALVDTIVSKPITMDKLTSKLMYLVHSREEILSKRKRETLQESTQDNQSVMRQAIFIVDSEVEISSILSMIISRIIPDFEVVSFTRATDSLLSMNQYDVVLLITSVYIPDMNTLEFISSIKQASPTTEIALNATSISKELMTAAMHHGVQYFFVKPFTVEELVSVLERVTTYSKKQKR